MGIMHRAAVTLERIVRALVTERRAEVAPTPHRPPPRVSIPPINVVWAVSAQRVLH